MALSKPVRRPLQELNGKTGWSVEGMRKAIEDVVSQKKGLRQAAREYGVPTTTLKRRVDTSLPAEATSGPSTALSKEEEDRLAQHIVTMAQMGFGLSPRDILALAFEIAENSGRKHPFIGNLLPKTFYYTATQWRKKLKPTNISYILIFYQVQSEPGELLPHPFW